MGDIENYIRMLEQKRDTEIPEIIKDLQLKLEMWKKAKADIDLEIQHLRATENRKTIFDLPAVGWQEVSKMLLQPQNEIHALSLTSEKFVDTALQKSSGFVKMEKAFSILLTNLYLDRDDLLNCTETTCEDLGKIAARTWHLLENPYYQSVDVNGSYENFRAEVERKRTENKIWTYFAGKIVQFNLRGLPSESWNESKAILQKYGKFFVNIELWLDKEDLETGEKTDYIHNMLLDGKLPNLQFFHVHTEPPIYGLRPEIETRSLQQCFCLWTGSGTSHVENKKTVFKLPALIAEAWHNNQSRGVVSFKKLKSLIYYWEYNCEKLRKRVITALGNGLFHTKELTVPAHNSISHNLQFAERFPALSKISIHIGYGFHVGRRQDFIVSRNIRLLTVRTLTYGLDGGPVVPHLGDILTAFPSLRCINLKTRCRRDRFVVLMKQVVEQAEMEANNINGNDDAEIAFGDFDIFQRISNEQPLTESNIWAQVPKLNVFCLITGTRMIDNKLKSKMVEKYTRSFQDREIIRMEKYMESVATQFPNTV